MSSLAPQLTVRDAAGAIAFWVRAFGARELERRLTPGDRRVLHARLQIGEQLVLLNDEFPEHGAHAPPERGSPVTFQLSVSDVEGAWARAVTAGCRVLAPLRRVNWGVRYGLLRDPFGHQWALTDAPGLGDEAGAAR